MNSIFSELYIGKRSIYGCFYTPFDCFWNWIKKRLFPIIVSLWWQPGRVDAELLNSLGHIYASFDDIVSVLIISQLSAGFRLSSTIIEGQNFCKVKISRPVSSTPCLCPVQLFNCIGICSEFCTPNKCLVLRIERANKSIDLQHVKNLLDNVNRCLGHPFRCLLSTG